MKAKSFFKREIALLLVVVMLFSCWVFTATQSTSATAGSYSISVDAISDNDGDCKGRECIIYYYANNGTTKTEQTTTICSSSSDFTFNGSGGDDGSTTVAGFPFKVVYRLQKRGGLYSLGTLKYHVNITVAGTSMGSSNTTETSSEGWSSVTWTASTSQYPVANYITSFGLASGQTATLTNPTGNNTVTKSISMGTVKDQYGVNWYQDPVAYVAGGTGSSGYSVSGSTVTIGSGALATASNWKTTGIIGVRAGSSSGTVLKTEKNGSTNATVTFTGTNPTYTTTWKWHNNGDSSTTWSGSTTKTGVYYNENPSAPSAATTTTSYYDADKHYSGGKYNTSAITGATTFNMTYPTSAAHSYTYSPIANNDTNHTASCSCGYNKAVEHTYGKYSDNGNGTHSRTCGTTGCGYVETKAHTWGAWQIIPDGESANYGGHDRMAKHYRVCTKDGCTAKDYDNHTWVAQTIQAPTCTTDGHTPYKCSQCQLTTVDLNTDDDGVEDFQPMLGHDFQYDSTGEKTDTQHTEACSRCDATRMVDHSNYGDWYEVNGTTHAHDCGVCGKAVTATHSSWSGWQHAAPTAEETGVRAIVRETLATASYDAAEQCYNYCTDCGSVKYQNHKWNDGVTTPAKCEEEGKTVYTCTDCQNTKEEKIDALGHDPELKRQSTPDDRTAGKCYYQCTRCDKYFAAFDDGTDYYPDDTAQDTLQEALAVEGSADIPAPTFNSYNDSGIGYNYDDRGASLKLTKETEAGVNTIQKMRFAGSVAVPANMDNEIKYANY
ncbi:MAG: hypothetical protein IJG23_07240, partial [Clostridia bacterium]|nr:hypothetical protein [Clostridia bacterium]